LAEIEQACSLKLPAASLWVSNPGAGASFSTMSLAAPERFLKDRLVAPRDSHRLGDASSANYAERHVLKWRYRRVRVVADADDERVPPDAILRHQRGVKK